MAVKPKTTKKKVVQPKPTVDKTETVEEPKIEGGQYALFGAVKGNKTNRNTLAYKMANKSKNVNYFKIDNTEMAQFLGQIERKNKESVVISLTGGQGSMKTRMAFQFMNAMAQNYKVGHASIEEHPESNLYFDKAEQYLNAKALNHIEAPEVKSVQELEQLIVKNDVIVIDSFTKMQEMHKGFEVDKDLRKKYDGKLFLVIFQQTTDGKMRGGSKSQFDADIVLFTEKKTDYRENYVYADKNRYQDQKWLIYDSKRGYGVYYDLNVLEIITLDDTSVFGGSQKDDMLHDIEINYQKLWIEYFDHTNIKERKNDKLHVQHVPKRYWKYLTEKKVL